MMSRNFALAIACFALSYLVVFHLPPYHHETHGVAVGGGVVPVVPAGRFLDYLVSKRIPLPCDVDYIRDLAQTAGLSAWIAETLDAVGRKMNWQVLCTLFSIRKSVEDHQSVTPLGGSLLEDPHAFYNRKSVIKRFPWRLLGSRRSSKCDPLKGVTY
jgi:hypothetical protein